MCVAEANKEAERAKQRARGEGRRLGITSSCLPLQAWSTCQASPTKGSTDSENGSIR